MKKSPIVTQSPGRINIIGDHTDYNEGYVLPAAIDKKTVVKLQFNDHISQCRVKAGNLQEIVQFDLHHLRPMTGGWQNYVMGVVHELQQAGGILKGFNCEFEGNVPIGSGMSSSAALECSLAYGLNELFALGFDKWQLVKAAQMAEHNFVGIKCGIMDQFASMMGKKDQAMLLDCRSLEYEYFPLDLGEYELLLLNTNVTHALASSEYNDRRAECEEGVSFFRKKYPQILSLRDVDSEMLLESGTEMTNQIYRRCRHVIMENERVQQAAKALRNGDLEQLGRLMYQSHFSLQNDYEVSCIELDYLVEQTLEKHFVLGSRMMGGGFGGCTISLIESKMTEAFIELISESYRERFGIELTPYTVSIEDGTGLIS